jgi:hypothetical protein
MSEIIDSNGNKISDIKKHVVLSNLEHIEELVQRAREDLDIVYRQLYPTGCTLEVKPVNRVQNCVANIQNCVKAIRTNL